MVRLVEVDEKGNPVEQAPDGVLKRGANGKYRVPELTGSEAVRAGVAGVNRGFWADLLGVPADAAANTLDLAKAAAGYTISKFNKDGVPPEWTEPYDRSKVPLSSEWLAKQYSDAGLSGAINNPRPDSSTARVLFGSGRVAGASVVPSPRASISATQNAVNMAKGAAAGAAGQGAVEAGYPEYAFPASMAPGLLVSGVTGGAKAIVRGGEQGRRAMEQRIKDLENGGITEPSVGLASGNTFIQGIENVLSKTPGSMGQFARASEKNIEGMHRRASEIRDDISPVFGPVEAGAAIQADLKGPFKDRINRTYGALNDRFAQTIPPDQRFPIDGTLSALDAATAVNPMAPNTTAAFVQPRIAGLRANILADTTQPVPGVYYNATRNVGLPLSAIKDIRTDIGKEAASRAIFGTPEQAEFKQLYGGLSADMQNAARITDLSAGPQPNNLGPAQQALGRANTYYRNAMQRADGFNGLANRDTPEGAYSTVARSLDAGPTVYQRLRGVLQTDTRQKIVSTIVDELGQATPGQQNADGSSWSPRTFLTNYNRLDPKSKVEMFKRMPGGEQHAENLSDIAKTAEMLGDASKIYSNPSGTAANLATRTTLGTIALGFFASLWHPIAGVAAATAASGMGAANLGGRLLLNPMFSNWLAKSKSVRPGDEQAYMQRLIANAKLSKDAQFQQDVSDYVNLVNGQAQGQ